MNTKTDRPIFKTQSQAMKGYPVITSSIPHLLSMNSPSDIARFIVSVIVNTIQGMLTSWPLAHVIKEIFKLSPALAYGYTPFLVSGMSLYSVNHSNPAFVCQAVGLAVTNARFLFQTPAGASFTSYKVASQHGSLNAAITSTNPRGVLTVPVIAKYYETAKPLSGQGFPWPTFSNRIWDSHAVCSYLANGLARLMQPLTRLLGPFNYNMDISLAGRS